MYLKRKIHVFVLTMPIHVGLEIRLMGSKKGDIEAFVNCVFGVCCSFATKLRNAYYASSCFNAAAMAYKKHINHMQQSLTLDGPRQFQERFLLHQGLYTAISRNETYLRTRVFFTSIPLQIPAQGV